MKTTSEKVIAKMIKSGNNENDAIKMVSKYFTYVIQNYPNANTAKVAEIISCLSAM